jgi:hypothetical protein
MQWGCNDLVQDIQDIIARHPEDVANADLLQAAQEIAGKPCNENSPFHPPFMV